MNGPPSSGQQVRAGRRSSRISLVRTSVSGARVRDRMPMPSSAPATSRAPQSFAGVGGSSVSASSTRRRMSCSGRVPKASSALRAVPNRFVASGKDAPVTFVKSSAGPPAAMTRRWTSAASRFGSTGASTTARSPSRRSRSMNARRSGKPYRPIDTFGTIHQTTRASTRAPAPALAIAVRMVTGLGGAWRRLSRVLSTRPRIARRLGARPPDTGIIDKVVEHERAHAPPGAGFAPRRARLTHPAAQ